MKNFRMGFIQNGAEWGRSERVRLLLMSAGAVAAFGALLGCKSSTSTGAPDGTQAPYNPPVGYVDNAKFYVRVYDENKFDYYMEADDSFGTECAIPFGSDPKSIRCDLRVKEGDLFYWGLKLQANIPTGMCDYSFRKPYYYYNFEPGVASGSVVIKNNSDGTGTCSGTDYYGNTATYAGGSCVFPSWTAQGNGGVYSRFDHSSSGGPNCAVGKYSVTIVAPDGSTSQASGDFGGRWGNCLAGPAVSGLKVDDGSSWPVANNGYPLSKVSSVLETGFNEVWDISSPLSVGRSSNVRIANGYNYQYQFRSGARVHSVASNGYLPEAIYPTIFTGPPSTQPYYGWLCLDKAFEVKYAISLYVHEFNTVTEHSAYETTGGAKGSSGANPDMDGDEGSSPVSPDCNYLSGHGFVCNDNSDWDDLVGSFPSEL